MINKISSIPVSPKRQIFTRRRLFFFSSALFLLVLALGSAAFVVLMKRIRYENAGNELMQTVKIERLEVEAYLNGEIAAVLKSADSSLVRRYFLNPEDGELRNTALEEIAGYRRAFAGNNTFHTSGAGGKYYGGEYVLALEAMEESPQRHNSIFDNPVSFSLTVNFDAGLKSFMLRIDAPVFDDDRNPIGVVGSGVNLSEFISAVCQNYDGEAELYFFNAAGEITWAKDAGAAAEKINILSGLGQSGGGIFAGAKKLKEGEAAFIKTNDGKGTAAYCSIPALDWYVTAVRRFTVKDYLNTGMTVLFGAMTAVILFVLVFLNLFVMKVMKPLNSMVKKITQTLSDWELIPQADALYKDEIGALGELFNMTIIDELTGIYNRRYLDGNLKKIIKVHSRSGSNLSLLMLDIDYFKKYNDSYGHDAGDDCLRTIAAAVSQCVNRSEDFAARYGGEEFVVVLPSTDRNGARVVAENILKKIRECGIPHKASDIADHVTVSIGGTTAAVKYPQTGSDYVKNADKALYESKRNGRDRYTFEDFEE
jgi:diguanylate cyclase (GGDEF)-like protein